MAAPSPNSVEAFDATGSYQNAESQHKTLASQGQRLGTFLVDMLCCGVVAATVMMVFHTENRLVWYGILLAYYTTAEIITGRTLGKLVTGTRAIREDGADLTLKDAVLRTLCRYVPFEIFSFVADRPRGWHDRWSRTLVITTR